MTANWVDRLGGVSSAACASHCLLMAFAPALVSWLGLEILRHEALEWGLFGLAVCLGVAAAGHGHRSYGGSWVLGGFGAGILLLSAGRLGEAWGLIEGSVYFAVAGGSILVGSHAVSAWRCQASCRP